MSLKLQIPFQTHPLWLLQVRTEKISFIQIND